MALVSFWSDENDWNKIEVMAAHYECAKRCFTAHLQMVTIMLCEF